MADLSSFPGAQPGEHSGSCWPGGVWAIGTPKIALFMRSIVSKASDCNEIARDRECFADGAPRPRPTRYKFSSQRRGTSLAAGRVHYAEHVFTLYASVV